MPKTDEVKKDGPDLEMHAMRRIAKMLGELEDDASRARVLAFATAKTLGKELAAPMHAYALELTGSGR